MHIDLSIIDYFGIVVVLLSLSLAITTHFWVLSSQSLSLTNLEKRLYRYEKKLIRIIGMIIIIGGSGFIGTRLSLRLFNSRRKFIVIDKVANLLFSHLVKIADVRYPLPFTFASEDSVLINLAAEHRDNVQPPSLYNDVNVIGAINTCELAKNNNVNKIIFTSSVAVYGFASPGTAEDGPIAPFNDYGLTKWKAETIYRRWHAESPQSRTLVIVRPTVVFGEGNRGNVFNLFRAISARKFVMIGSGLNRKSMAYVENVAAFLEYSLSFKPGVHIYNYVDKPDFSMNVLVAYVNKLLGRPPSVGLRLPFFIALLIGIFFDYVGKIFSIDFPVSAIRIKKFCSTSVYDSAVESTGFIPPVPLREGINRTINHDFIVGTRS